jgi:hypothetical protein
MNHAWPVYPPIADLNGSRQPSIGTSNLQVNTHYNLMSCFVICQIIICNAVLPDFTILDHWRNSLRAKFMPE